MKANFTHCFALILMVGMGVFPIVAYSHPVPVPPPGNITLEDLWLKGTYMPDFPNDFRWMKDDRYYSEMEEGKISRYSIQDEKKLNDILDITALSLPKGIAFTEIDGYEFNADESNILLTAQTEPIYRHSSVEICMVWDKKRNKVHLLQDGNKVSEALFSPDGNKIGYVYNNNLYYYEIETEKTIQVSFDGKKNFIINGTTDWVYEEEFSFTQGFLWSAKGNYLAFYRFDESEVKEFSMDIYEGLYPNQTRFKYPKAGEKNSDVSIFIYDLEKAKLQSADLGKEKDLYIPRIKWTQNEDVLAVMKMNRLQNKLEVVHVNAITGKSVTVLSEVSDTCIDVTDDKWYFMKNHPDMLWMSEQNGYNHIYRYGMDGKLIGQITAGNFDVLEMVGVDEKTDKIYFTSSEISPMEKHLYSISLDGKDKKKLTEASGFHAITFSSGYTYYIDSYSSMQHPGKTDLRQSKDGTVVKKMIDNQRLEGVLKAANLGKTEFFQFKIPSGESLNGWMLKPANFDKKKKYPVLMYVYGGPGSQTVKNEWGYSNHIWFQMLAQQGYIVVSVDGRGTGARGAKFKKTTYADMGNKELQDQIEGAKYLQTLPFVDKNRIGIWGWSFGGYMTSLCMTRGNGIFKAGIAVAPVTNWRYYDSIYTERYLQTPQDNAKGYDENSPINYAKDLKGKYLLVHGSADDNVHFQNSMEWISALVKAGKQFDLMVYPNKNHSIGGGASRYHLYQKMTDFLKVNL